MNTKELIEKLSQETPRGDALRPPLYYIKNLSCIMIVYAIGLSLFTGTHEHLVSYLINPYLILELLFLLFIAGGSMMTSIFSLYPDMYQKKGILSLPFSFFIGFLVFMIGVCIRDYFTIHNISIYTSGVHNMECSYALAGMSIIPSMIMFFIIHKGATTVSFLSGFYSVLTASAIGCFILRLSEIDSPALHVFIWHYIPTFLFAVGGSFLGRYLLRW